jgi:DNA replication protein DnaC
MTHDKNCLLAEVCNAAGGSTCNKLCPFYNSIHGHSGKGGRLAESNIPLDYSKMTVTRNPVRDAQPEVFEIIDGYVKKSFPRIFEGGRIRSLYLFSEEPGTGKTSTACSIANEYLVTHFTGCLERGITPPDRVVFFLDFNYWQSVFNEFNHPRVPKDHAELASEKFYSMRDAAKKAQFLVIDDIGIRDPSEAFGAIAHDLINYRVMNRLPTIYTSNVPMEDLMNKYDSRLWDRIRDHCFEIEFDGGSHRGIRNDFDS